MKKRHLTLSALALIVMAACTDATGVAPDELAGTWTATSMVFTSVADPTMSVDVVADGAAMTLVLSADGTYTFNLVFPGEPTEDEAGGYTVSGDLLTITPTDLDPETFTIARDGDTMTLTDAAEVFDFTVDVEEAATLVITLTR